MRTIMIVLGLVAAAATALQAADADRWQGRLR